MIIFGLYQVAICFLFVYIMYLIMFIFTNSHFIVVYFTGYTKYKQNSKFVTFTC